MKTIARQAEELEMVLPIVKLQLNNRADSDKFTGWGSPGISHSYKADFPPLWISGIPHRNSTKLWEAAPDLCPPTPPAPGKLGSFNPVSFLA